MSYIETPYLCFGSEQARIDYGVPYLPCAYSYLIKIASDVGVVETYPWLAELIFHSAAAPYEDLINEIEKQKGGSSAKRHPTNVVTITIDESMDSLPEEVIPRDSDYKYRAGELNFSDPTANYIRHIISRGGYVDDAGNVLGIRSLGEGASAAPRKPAANAVPLPRLFQIDTLGSFGEPLSEQAASVLDLPLSVPLYSRNKIVGSGNPMRLLQRFMSLRSVTELGAVGYDLAKDRTISDYQKEIAAYPLGPLNCVIINSIGNLARRMGFRDAMHLIRAIIERTVWGLGDRSPDGLFDRPGMLFALVSEDVMTEPELRYVETFFDGVIRFKAVEDQSADNVIYYEFERFPLVEVEAAKAGNQPKRKPATSAKQSETVAAFNEWFAPNFGMRYQYQPLAGQRLSTQRVARPPKSPTN